MKKVFLLVFAISLYSLSYAQYRLVEKFEPKDILENGQANILKIPFSKYTFNNELTLIVSEDHSNPLVNVNVTYKVGSANDYTGSSGMAYMLFKLMDKGSKHLHSGEYQSIVTQYGGKMFSKITRDRTTFSVTVPKNLLATVLWMESDRQAYFIDSLTLEKFDKTKQDIIASLSSQKDGSWDDLVQKNLYVSGHPYTWPVNGIVDYYQAFTLTDLKKYFLDWYGSNNTILTITGDIKTQEVVDLVNTYFGTLTKAPISQSDIDELINRMTVNSGIEKSEARFISYKADVPNPILKIVYNTVPKFNQDEKALNAIASLLGQGKQSILYNELVKNGYAVSVNAQHKTYKYSGEFTIEVKANADTSLAVILAKINTILNDISRRRNIADYIPEIRNSYIQIIPESPPQTNLRLQPGIQHGKITKVQQEKNELMLKNREELSFNESKSGELLFQTISKLKLNELMLVESLQNKGNSLAERELITGKPENISPSLSEYNDISPSRIYEVFNKYLSIGAKLYVSVVPKNKGNLIAAPDNIVESVLNPIHIPTTTQDLVYRYPVYDINNKNPKVIDLAFLPEKEVKTDSAQNGMIVSLEQNNNFPLVCFNIRMDASEIMKIFPNLDIPVLIAAKYNEWFEKQGLENPLKAASLKGISVEFIPNDQYVDIHLICSKEQEILAKESILQFLYRPEYNLTQLYLQLIPKYNDISSKNIYRKSDVGNIIKTISGSPSQNSDIDDSVMKPEISNALSKRVSSAFSRMYNPENMTADVYGNIDNEFYHDFYMQLSAWHSPGNISVENEGAPLIPDLISVNEKKIPSEKTVFFLPDDNKQTAMIILEYMQIPVETSPNYYTGKLANYIFGMSSGNQLSKNLATRDYIQKIRTISYYRNKKECFAVIINVTPDKLTDAYVELLIDLDNFKTFKPEKSYFNLLKNEYLYKDIANYETFYQKELFINNLISNKIPAEVFNNQYVKTKKIKASQIAKFWKSNYIPGNARTVIIGNEDQLKTNMSKTGNNIIKIDKSGTVINQIK